MGELQKEIRHAPRAIASGDGGRAFNKEEIGTTRSASLKLLSPAPALYLIKVTCRAWRLPFHVRFFRWAILYMHYTACKRQKHIVALCKSDDVAFCCSMTSLISVVSSKICIDNALLQSKPCPKQSPAPAFYGKAEPCACPGVQCKTLLMFALLVCHTIGRALRLPCETKQ